MILSFGFKPISKRSRIRMVKAIGARGRARERRPQNVEGDFFVDHTCIDCDTCRWMAQEIFTRADGMSAVSKQPTRREERLKALQALVACPTGSIRTEEPPTDILEAQETFPVPIDQQKIPSVYHCGYHSEKSYGAASYLIVHSEGNILIDSPRYSESLARKIETLGTMTYMFLTHNDDIADHEKWSKRLNCDRILHSRDKVSVKEEYQIYCSCKPGKGIIVNFGDNHTQNYGRTSKYRRRSGPWNLDHDIQLIHTPGHSAGSVCLYYKPLKILFTGDHLAMTDHGLSIWERYNQCSVPMQLESVCLLLELDFKWIIPGHGRRFEFKDAHENNSNLKALIRTFSRENVECQNVYSFTHVIIIRSLVSIYMPTILIENKPYSTQVDKFHVYCPVVLDMAIIELSFY